jgi:uncharacterized protein YjiS (DUF1127 family)
MPRSSMTFSRRKPVNSAWRRVAARGRGIGEAVAVWLERVRTRRHLTRLNDHMLKDIGISRTDVAREAEKPFWRR